ncbi:MAG: NAD-dependent DNA ligase LigA [Deltaproteobacteria bacterium]|nr:NAD-dependent DNA ligase LigA [Deltaproteobacteria bacterium]
MNDSHFKPSYQPIHQPLTLENYLQLVSLIQYHDDLYHSKDAPVITDFEYDQLFLALKHTEELHPDWIRPDSPSHRVGGKTLSHFEKSNHRAPMLSLSNSYNQDDIFSFDERIKKFLNTKENIHYFCEPKFDGLSMELVYENGLLTKALTRGDGLTGELVTQNVKTIKSIPLKLKTTAPPELLEVRGEVLIHKEDFFELNNSQQEEGLPAFANPRNAAAGTIRQLDSKITASRPLKFYAYTLGDFVGIGFETQLELYEKFSQLGIPTFPSLTRVCENAQEVVNFYHEFESKRHRLPFDVDGIVIKVSSFKLQAELGMISKSPRWATAAKFPPQQAQTIITDIICQVGRTGAITPVAIMSPVSVGGVTVTNATLHNQEEIDRKDIRIGDTVVVQRAGDVIPEVVDVVLSKRNSNSSPFKMPTHCPSCGEPLLAAEEEVVFRCVNMNCSAILKESLKHFASRKALNIEKLGDKWIDILVDKGFVRKFSDFYRLTKEDLLTLERQGEKSAQNILESLNKSKKTTLARLLFGLGIRFVGETTAKHLANHFLTIENFLGTEETNLLQIPEIGPKVAMAILNWLQSPANIEEVSNLIQVGITFEKIKRTNDGPLQNKSFLITGTLEIPRDQAKELIEVNGGKLLSSVSSKLNYLVVGNDPGSKLEKAKNLGVHIISWDELVKMIS